MMFLKAIRAKIAQRLFVSNYFSLRRVASFKID